MTSILALGKGKAYQIFIHGFGLHEFADREDELAYYVKMDQSDLLMDGWLPGSQFDL